MGDLAKQFLSFDKPFGAGLVKILYFIGLAGILFAMLGAMRVALAVFDFSAWSGIKGLFGALIMAVVMTLFWRALTEIVLSFLKMSDDVSAIRKQGADAK